MVSCVHMHNLEIQTANISIDVHFTLITGADGYFPAIEIVGHL